MTEKQYETALLALGCKNVTTQSQAGNGTTAFKLSELRTIYTFADIFSGNVTQSEILYGDNIFNTK
jgi:hypothetical protein